MIRLLTAAALLALALPGTVDAIVRRALRRRRHLPPQRTPGTPPQSVTVLIPARSEGSRLQDTLDSVVRERAPMPVRVVVLLDGDDPDAERIARARGASFTARTAISTVAGALVCEPSATTNEKRSAP